MCYGIPKERSCRVIIFLAVLHVGSAVPVSRHTLLPSIWREPATSTSSW